MWFFQQTVLLIEKQIKNLNDFGRNRVTISPMSKKVISATLSVFLLAAFNFCLVECACASEHHHSEGSMEVSGHDHESSHKDHDADSEKHDVGSLCCSSLVADQIPSDGFSRVESLKSNAFSSFISAESFFTLFLVVRPQYRAKFPPGTSPPAVFLSTYFTHAPPVVF